MPRRALRPCGEPGCPALVTSGRCPAHQRERQRASDTKSDEARAFYGSGRWKTYRARYLRDHPLCVICSATGRVEAATTVDHIVSMRDGGAAWDPDNHQALCTTCHQRKRAQERVAAQRRQAGKSKHPQTERCAMSGETEGVQEQADEAQPVAMSAAGAVQRRIEIRHAPGEPGINRVQAWCPICEWAGTPTFDQEQARAEARQHAEQAPYVTEREALAVMAAARGGSARARREAHHLHAPPTVGLLGASARPDVHQHTTFAAPSAPPACPGSFGAEPCGTELIAAERERQRQRYDSAHDDAHGDGSLVHAAALFAATTYPEFSPDSLRYFGSDDGWVEPWLRYAYQKHHNDPVRRLAIAGALIAAEIDRLQRLATPEVQGV
jgi:5-methylcytosine-specific restriction protein A